MHTPASRAIRSTLHFCSAQAPTSSIAVANPTRYALGFMTGTALLHVAGVLIGDIARHYARGQVILRMAGAGIAGAGTWFLLGLSG